MKSQIFDSQNSAGAGEGRADGIGRIGKYSFIIARHRFDDRERLGWKLAVDIVALLVAGVLHIADKNPVLIQVVPAQQRDLFLAPRREQRERDDLPHRNREGAVVSDAPEVLNQLIELFKGGRAIALVALSD